MSKSRGTFITARKYLENFPAEYLRYYFAAKLGPGIDDMDMNLDEFATRLNSEIVGKLVNIASRCAGFIARTSGGKLAKALAEPDLHASFVNAGGGIAKNYDSRDTAAAIRDIMALCDRANQYVDSRKPWMLAKDPKNAVEVQNVCTQALNLFRVLMIYLEPVLPKHGRKRARLLPGTGLDLGHGGNAAALHFHQCIRSAGGPAGSESRGAAGRARGACSCRHGPPAFRRLATAAPRMPRHWRSAASVEGNLISIDDFLRIDLRVAKVLAAEFIVGRRQAAEAARRCGRVGRA